VISLLDPTQTLDYENELWHVFNSMPTVTDVERRYGILEDNEQDNDHSHGLQHTLQVKKELKALKSHTRMDAHSLGRLRVRDRHSIPPSLTYHDRTSRQQGHTSFLDTTIRFEVLRYSDNLKRGSGRDCNRLEVELSGPNHTLLDLHRVIFECAYAAEDQCDERGDGSVLAGVFFIENQFYTYGVSGDAAGDAILHWLDGHQSTDDNATATGCNEEVMLATSPQRRKHLCISSYNHRKSMSEIYLDDLPLRLGIRYVHIFFDRSCIHSNKIGLRNESTLFATDIQTHKCSASKGPSNDIPNHSSFISHAPIIHDKWTTSKPTTLCSACNCSVATVVTMSDELTCTSSEGTPLCAVCFRDLHYQATNSDCELRPGSAHQSFKVLSIDSFKQLALKNDMMQIQENAIFKRI
jgi:hypothetical protein